LDAIHTCFLFIQSIAVEKLFKRDRLITVTVRTRPMKMFKSKLTRRSPLYKDVKQIEKVVC